MALNKPPINTQADSIAVKGWFTDVYKELNSGILVPRGGVITAPIFPSRRNLLVNGDFMINQRQGTFYSATSSLVWTLDRWGLSGSGGVFLNLPLMSSAANPIVGFQTFVTIDFAPGNALSFPVVLAQAVESARIIPLAGLPVVLSFWLYGEPAYSSNFWVPTTINNSTGIVQAQVISGTGVNEGTAATFTGNNIVASLGVNPSKSFFTYYRIYGTIPLNAKELKVVFQATKSTTSYVANSSWGLTGIQLEIGIQPTAFDKISFDESLLECQRFYEKSFDYSVTPGPITNDVRGAITYKVQVASTTAGWDAPIAFKVRKAKDPTMTAYCINNAGAPTDWWNFTRIATSGVSAFAGTGEWGFVARNPQVAADAVGNEIGLHWDASADI